MTPRFHTYPDRHAQAEELASIVADELRRALENSERAALAVPGGTTPGPFLTALSARALDWTRVAVLATDERLAPPDSARSNGRLIRQTLLRHRASASQFVPLISALPVSDDQLTETVNAIAPLLPLDVCVLGMGADMHTASLFPRAAGLDEALRLDTDHILCRIEAPGASESRLSMTVAVLAGARHRHLMITGANKKAAIEEALSGTDAFEAPVRAILTAPRPIDIHYSD